MYEPYTRQSLPSKEYRELLGSALCVFSSNNGFIIENIIHTSNAYDWYNLIDLESGKLKKSIADTISRNTGNKDIEILFSEIVEIIWSDLLLSIRGLRLIIELIKNTYGVDAITQ